MMYSSQRILLIWVGFLSLALTQHLSAQGQKPNTETTWYDTLSNQEPRELVPKKVEILSIQVSKLPRDTFGGGKHPWRMTSLDSFVTASGTGIYGYMDFKTKGDLKYREDISGLKKFVDATGRDLTLNPTDEEIDTFFPENKPLSIKLTPDQTKAIFTIRGYSTPVAGAKTVEATAEIKFLYFIEEKTKTVETKLLGATDKIEVGPVSFRVSKNLGKAKIPRGVKRWSGNTSGNWALGIDARQKPVKVIEILDEESQVLWERQGPSFEGKSYRQYIDKFKGEPSVVRVTWYEKWELITVPLKIQATLGI